MSEDKKPDLSETQKQVVSLIMPLTTALDRSARVFFMELKDSKNEARPEVQAAVFSGAVAHLMAQDLGSQLILMPDAEADDYIAGLFENMKKQVFSYRDLFRKMDTESKNEKSMGKGP